jgi:hypothetical protein
MRSPFSSNAIDPESSAHQQQTVRPCLYQYAATIQSRSLLQHTGTGAGAGPERAAATCKDYDVVQGERRHVGCQLHRHVVLCSQGPASAFWSDDGLQKSRMSTFAAAAEPPEEVRDRAYLLERD